MRPCFIIHTASGDKDWTWILNARSIKYSRNDIDTASSGRNTLDAEMRRKRVAIKDKWEFSNLKQLTTEQAIALNADLLPETIEVTMLSPRDGIVRKKFYGSTISAATVYYDEDIDDTLWEDITFNLTEV